VLIRDAQITALKRVRRDRFIDKLTSHLGTYFPAERRVLGPMQMRTVCEVGLVRANAHGLLAAGDACRYVTLMFFLGSHFDRDPQLPWAADALASKRGTPGARMDRLYAVATAHIAQISGSGGELYTRALLRARRLPFEALAARIDGILRHILPEKYEAIGSGGREALLALARAKATAAAFTTPEGQALNAILMFLLGAHYLDDPLHPWAAEALAPNLTGDRRARHLYESARATLDMFLAPNPAPKG
jgi:hypothetical protein